MQQKPCSPSTVDSGYGGKEGKSRGTVEESEQVHESKHVSTAPLTFGEGFYLRQSCVGSELGSYRVL